MRNRNVQAESKPGRSAPLSRGLFRISLVALGTAAVAVALVAGCESEVERLIRPAVAGSLTILFSSDNQGVLVSCGCTSVPTGGLAKRQTIIDKYRRVRPNVLVVDAGNMFPDHPNALKVKYLAMILERAKYDAMGLGEQEFDMGVPKLQSMAGEYKLPFICANVRDAAGNPVVPPHVVRQTAGRRVGIFAVISDQAPPDAPSEWRKSLKVESPIEAAKREVHDLADCDLIVALSHQSRQRTEELAKQVPGIHVVVCGQDEAPLRQPLKVGETMIVATGPLGHVLGAVTYSLGAGGSPEVKMALSDLTAKVSDAGMVTDLYGKYIKQAKGEPPPEWAHLPVPVAYETAEDCAKCHEAEYKQWSPTRHANAYATLKKAGREQDPECLLCHTMGYGREGGFNAIDTTPRLANVTCQACHIVTSKHGVKGASPEAKQDPHKFINARLCMTCHGLMESPHFDFYAYKAKIAHNAPKAEKK
jgi:hypothetical protein